MGPYGTIQYSTIYGTIQDHMGSFRTIWDHIWAYGTILYHIWDHTIPYGTIRYHTVPYGTNWTMLDNMGPYGTIWDHTVPYCTNWAIQKHRGPYGSTARGGWCPLEIAGVLPKIISILALRVTPIFIGFTNRFFLLFTDSSCVNPM